MHQSKRIQCAAPGKAKAIATKAMAANGFIQKIVVVLAEGQGPSIRRKRAAKEEEKSEEHMDGTKEQIKEAKQEREKEDSLESVIIVEKRDVVQGSARS